MIIKPIPGYEGKYSISEFGQILSHAKSYGFGMHKERWLKPSLCNGYLVLLLGRGKKNYHRVHHLVALTFLEKIPGKKFINHKDGNKLNNHFSNLEWCTNLENIKHAWENGFSFKKLISDAEIIEMIKLRNQGMLYNDIAKKYNLRRETVSNIIRKKGRFNKDFINEPRHAGEIKETAHST